MQLNKILTYTKLIVKIAMVIPVLYTGILKLFEEVQQKLRQDAYFG